MKQHIKLELCAYEWFWSYTARHIILNMKAGLYRQHDQDTMYTVSNIIHTVNPQITKDTMYTVSNIMHTVNPQITKGVATTYQPLLF